VGFHRYTIEEDQARDAFLLQSGMTVLRFENKYVFENTDWVLGEIRKHFKRK
jgi:very-short-patch-repair endonuclease